MCVYSAFQSILPHVQLLWELVLVGEVGTPDIFSPDVNKQFLNVFENVCMVWESCGVVLLQLVALTITPEGDSEVLMVMHIFNNDDD